MSELSSKDKATLRGMAQNLKPKAHVGKNGLSEGFLRELKFTFKSEDLVKIGFKGTREEIEALIEGIEKATDSQCVGGVGKRRSFYRELVEEES